MVGIARFSPPFLLIESGFADKEQFCVGLKGSLVCCSIQHKPCAVEAFTPVSVDRHRALSASRILPPRPTKYRYTNKQKHKYKNTQIRIFPTRAAKVRPSVSLSGGSTYRQSSILWSWLKQSDRWADIVPSTQIESQKISKAFYEVNLFISSISAV